MHTRLNSAGASVLLATRATSRRAMGLLVLLGFLPAIAFAQQYRVEEVDRRALANRVVVNNSLANEAAYVAAKDREFTEYFTKAFFPAMTQTDPTSLAKTASLRDDLFKNILLKTSNRQLQADLTAITFLAAGTMVASPGHPPQPPYHPAVRYNAVLILGMLDEVYANQGGAAKPYPNATKALVTIVASATTSTKFPPPVIVGALIGLERHAQLQPTAQTSDEIVAAVLKVVTHDEPVQGLDSETYDWMRLRAAGVLAQLGSVGKENQNYNALLQLIAKLKSLDDRCEAAALLAKLKYDGAKVDGALTAEHLLKLTADVAEAELTRAVEFENPSGGAGFQEFSSRGRGGDVEISSKNQYPRRPLLAHLVGLRQALTATKPLLPADSQTKFDAILAAVSPVIVAATDKDTIELAIASRVREMSAALRRITAAAVPAAAAINEF